MADVLKGVFTNRELNRYWKRVKGIDRHWFRNDKEMVDKYDEAIDNVIEYVQKKKEFDSKKYLKVVDNNDNSNNGENVKK